VAGHIDTNSFFAQRVKVGITRLRMAILIALRSKGFTCFGKGKYPGYSNEIKKSNIIVTPESSK
jgi:hypothetical protein